MVSQHSILSTRFVTIFLRHCRFISIVMMILLGRVWVQHSHISKIKESFCLQNAIRVWYPLFRLADLLRRKGVSVSAGVTAKIYDRVEKKKAQICRLSLLNIVRCTMNGCAFIIASCGLTRNIPVRCYV